MINYAREGVTGYGLLTPVPGFIPAGHALKEMCPETA